MNNRPELIYGLNDLPPAPRALVYGIQWAVIFLPTLTILSSICSEFLGLHGSAKVLFFQRLLLMTGGMMILQTLWGHRYPLLDGPASALLLSVIVLAPHGMQAIQGGMLAGGGLLVLLGAFGLMRYLAPLFTDNVIGVILILIAITLLPYLAPMIIGATATSPDGDSIVFGISVLIILAIALFSHWLRGFPKTIALFLGIILGTVLMGVLGRVSFGGLKEAAWVSLPHPLVAACPKLSLAAGVTFFVAYVAVIINAVGSIYSIGEVVGGEGMSKRVSRGIAATGVGGMAAGAMGVIGTVSYAFSPGVVLVTRVGSRFPVTLCGVLLVSLAFFQKFLAVFSAIPASVVGAAMVTGMAAQVGAGISVLTRDGRSLDGRDYLVIGVPMLMGGIVSILPRGFFEPMPSTLQALLRNGLVVGIILVMLLEHVFLPKGGPRSGAAKLPGPA